MISSDYIPEGYEGAELVGSRDELLTAEFNGQVNLYIYPEILPYDFTDFANRIYNHFAGWWPTKKTMLEFGSGTESDCSTSTDFRDLKFFCCTGKNQNLKSRFDFINENYQYLLGKDRQPVLRFVRDYDARTKKLHVDGNSLNPDGRIMKTYTRTGTEWARNDDVENISEIGPGDEVRLKEHAVIQKLPRGSMSKHAATSSPRFVHRPKSTNLIHCILVA